MPPIHSDLGRPPSDKEETGDNPEFRSRLFFLPQTSAKEALPVFVLTVGAILVSLPLLWMFSTSLRPSSESYKLPPQWLPTQFHFENYGALFGSSVPFLTLFLNSLKITLAVTGGHLIFCSMAGFAFARLRFPARHLLFILLLASLMVPNQVTVIPIFLLMRTFGLIDTHLSIILPGLVSAFGVFMMRQFYLSLPQELIDAAKLDGAGPWRLYTRIALPLSTPALAALGIISFNATWNSYFYPLIFLNSWEKMTLPPRCRLASGVHAIRQSLGGDGGRHAGHPASVGIFLVAQRWIVDAFVNAGIKG